MKKLQYNDVPQVKADKRVPFYVTVGATFFTFSLVLFAIDFVPEPRVRASDATLIIETTVVGQAPTESTLNSVIPSDIVVSEIIAGLASNPVILTGAADVTPRPVSSSPVRIEIAAIGIDVAIITPESTNIDVLDRALLSGAVHFPESALPGENGNMLIFGHSSYLPVVRNKAFQAFNELGKLNTGTVITVLSDEYRYEYVVQEVRLADAEDTKIWFDADEPTLTLATCNTFGAKQERWIVTATLSSQKSL